MNAIIKALNHTDVSDEDYLKSVFSRLINVNFDGASVMSGHISGVQVCMTKMVPRLLYTHCAVHMLELAMLHSIKFDDSYLENINNNLDRILSFIIYWLWDDKN